MDEKREETRLIIRNKLQPSLVTLFQESKCPIRITSPPQRVARATLSLPQPHSSRETSVPELASRHVASNHPLPSNVSIIGHVKIGRPLSMQRLELLSSLIPAAIRDGNEEESWEGRKGKWKKRHMHWWLSMAWFTTRRVHEDLEFNWRPDLFSIEKTLTIYLDRCCCI